MLYTAVDIDRASLGAYQWPVSRVRCSIFETVVLRSRSSNTPEADRAEASQGCYELGYRGHYLTFQCLFSLAGYLAPEHLYGPSL